MSRKRLVPIIFAFCVGSGRAQTVHRRTDSLRDRRFSIRRENWTKEPADLVGKSSGGSIHIDFRDAVLVPTHHSACGRQAHQAHAEKHGHRAAVGSRQSRIDE